ncbi:MAG: hypothetical protein O3A06_13435 [Proteobacteria bacterium]|nr:hypothetical protein [Pseudomonadota bacterium]
MGLLQRILAAVIALAVFAAALVFASIALGIILAIALIAWGWLTWRRRKLRGRSAVVVEGEYREYRDGQEVRRIALDESTERREAP